MRANALLGEGWGVADRDSLSHRPMEELLVSSRTPHNSLMVKRAAVITVWNIWVRLPVVAWRFGVVVTL